MPEFLTQCVPSALRDTLGPNQVTTLSRSRHNEDARMTFLLHPGRPFVMTTPDGQLNLTLGYINPLSSGTPRNGQLVFRFQF
jgi:hypothetical protein